jgi:tetratricopeptide (TPR) repeat protein
MRRRQFLCIVGGAAGAWPLLARAQQPTKLPTIGFLGTSTPVAWSRWLAAFMQRLRELGWIDGRTVAIEVRWAEGGDMERGSDYVDRALAINPNLSNAWNARGWISACLGDGQRSLEAFNHSIRLNPFDDWTVFIAMRGKCVSLWTLGRYEEALEHVKKLAARAPKDLFVWFYRWVISSDPTIHTVFPNLRRSDLKRFFVQPVRSSPHRAMLEEAIDRLDMSE